MKIGMLYAIAAAALFGASTPVAKLLLATTLLVTGSFVLWARVFTPILKLSRAVKCFGERRLSTRTAVIRDDEMGDGCRTFNEMCCVRCH